MEELFNKIAPFNFWHLTKKETAEQFGFSRDFYLTKILKYINNSLIKVIEKIRHSYSFVCLQIEVIGNLFLSFQKIRAQSYKTFRRLALSR